MLTALQKKLTLQPSQILHGYAKAVSEEIARWRE